MLRQWFSRFAPCVRGLLIAAAAAPLSAGGNVTAQNPLPVPLFTIDNASPTAGGGLPIRGADILTHPGPTIVIARANLRAPNGANEVNGISFSAALGTNVPFLLRFGVDRATVGARPPEVGLVAQGFPFNVQQQAALRQAAADEYVSLRRFNRNGILPQLEAGPLSSSNNGLTRNQDDSGGVGYSLDPPGDPWGANPGPEDNGDGGADPTTAATTESGLSPLFFTLRRGSPALTTPPPTGLPGTGSGADIYRDVNLGASGGESLYVQPSVLTLLPADDIDALLVFDNGDGVFNPSNDQVLFSLTRDSPTVADLGRFSAADVITTSPAGLRVFATADQLGLLATDNVDSLEFAVCVNLEQCLRDWLIGAPNLSVPATSEWGTLLIGLALTGIGAWALRRCA